MKSRAKACMDLQAYWRIMPTAGTHRRMPNDQRNRLESEGPCERNTQDGERNQGCKGDGVWRP